MIDDDELAILMGGEVARQDRSAQRRVLVDLGRDLDVVRRQSRLLEHVQDGQGAPPASGQALQTPDYDPVSLLEVELRNAALGQHPALIVVVRTDQPETAGLVLFVEAGQRRVNAGDESSLGIGLIDQGFIGVVAGDPDDDHSVRLRGQPLTEVLQHLLGVPIGVDERDVKIQPEREPSSDG